MSRSEEVVRRLIEEGGLGPVLEKFRECGVRVSVWCTYRWCRSGRLPALKVGGIWQTNLPSIHKFLAEGTRAAQRRPRNAPPPTTSERSKAVLAKHGLTVGGTEQGGHK